MMFKGLIFFLKQGWKHDPKYILWNAILQIVRAATPVLAAVMPKFIIDELTGPGRIDRLMLYVGILAAGSMLLGALSSYLSQDGFTRRCRVNAAFDSDLHRRLYEADYGNLENTRFLDMQEKAKKFLYCDWHGFGYLLDCALSVLGQCLALAGVGAIVATLNGWIVGLFAILSVLGAMIEGRARRRAAALSQKCAADQRAWTYLADLFENHAYGKEMRLNGMGDWLIQRERECFTRINDNLKAQNDGFIRAEAIGSILTGLQQAAAYGWLIRCVLLGEIGLGDFAMMLAAVTAFGASLRSMMTAISEIRAYDLYYDGLEEYLSVPAKLRESGRKMPAREAAEIEFRDVSFRYAQDGSWALRHVNLVLRCGERLSVVGENGSGKTTLVKLLMRLYDPTEGTILLNGVDIREYDYDAYMGLFAAVFQDFKLFSLSVSENVSLAMDADRDRINSILRQVGLDDKIESLPKGADTAVYRNFDEGGFEPSGGEGQKLALARALYRNAPVIVLDEPTAALDARAEYELYRQFDALVEGRMAVYISHRMSSARFCDRIAVLDGGELVEAGTHEELMKRNGKYAQLFEMQARYYTD